jgi:hypothetical protein
MRKTTLPYTLPYKCPTSALHAALQKNRGFSKLPYLPYKK